MIERLRAWCLSRRWDLAWFATALVLYFCLGLLIIKDVIGPWAALGGYTAVAAAFALLDYCARHWRAE